MYLRRGRAPPFSFPWGSGYKTAVILSLGPNKSAQQVARQPLPLQAFLPTTQNNCIMCRKMISGVQV